MFDEESHETHPVLIDCRCDDRRGRSSRGPWRRPTAAPTLPKKYQGGAFIAFHGSWNRAPTQEGYNVTFQPFANGQPAGSFEVLAQGFAGAQAPRMAPQATHRADGVIEAPDGTLYISESAKGRLWRVIYTGTGK